VLVCFKKYFTPNAICMCALVNQKIFMLEAINSCADCSKKHFTPNAVCMCALVDQKIFMPETINSCIGCFKKYFTLNAICMCASIDRKIFMPEAIKGLRTRCSVTHYVTLSIDRKLNSVRKLKGLLQWSVLVVTTLNLRSCRLQYRRRSSNI